MENKLENVIGQFTSLMNFDITRRLFFLAGIAISVVIGLGINQWIQEPIYRPLDVQVNDKNMSAILNTLDSANIKYKLNDAANTISVPAIDITMARIKLAAAGIQKEEGFTFSFLNDKNKLGTSQFLENARYLHALEADLSKSIGAIQGVAQAIVHIAKPQNNIFADENAKTTASVILNITPGYDGDKEKIRAIVQLVAASVPELDPLNVAITDQYGHYLSSTLNSDYNHNQEQLSYQHSLERNYAARIQSLIVPVLGENGARISVNADIDFTRQEEAKEAFDPAQKIIRSEQTIKETSSSSGGSGVPGSLSNQPPSNGQQPQPSQGGQSRNETVKNYEIGKSTSYVKVEAPKLSRLSVAIVLDNEMVKDPKTGKVTSQPMTKEKMDKITELVKSSIGYSQSRGDIVTVVNSSFIQPETIIEKKPGLWEEPWFWDLFKKMAGIITGFVFLFIIYRKISPELGSKKTKTDLANTAASTRQNLISAEMIKLKNEQIEALRGMVSTDPNKVVGVIKKWVAK